MRITMWMLCLGGLLVGLVPVAQADEGEVELKMKYAAGLQLHYRSQDSYKRTVSGTQVSQPSVTTREATREFKITVLEQREDGGFDVRLDTLSIKANLDIPGEGRWIFDSAAPKERDVDNFISPAMRAVLETPFQVAIDSSGAPLVVAGMERWIDVSHIEIGRLFDHDYTKALFQSLTVEKLPAGAIKVGDSWDFQDRRVLGGLATMVSDSVAALADLEEQDGRSCARILIETVDSLEMNPAAAAQKVTAQIVDPSDTAEVTLDIELGQVKKMSNRGGLTLVIGYPGQPEEGKEPQQEELLGHEMLSAADLAKLKENVPKIATKDLRRALRERRKELGEEVAEETEEGAMPAEDKSGEHAQPAESGAPEKEPAEPTGEDKPEE
jgi:hypothetical protein